MEYTSQLKRHSSVSCVPLDVGHWCNRKSPDDEFYEDVDQMQYSPSGREHLLVVTRWRVLWRRILKEKRKIFNSAAPLHVPYDEYTYAQNFDEGTALVEPDNLSRSFSKVWNSGWKVDFGEQYGVNDEMGSCIRGAKTGTRKKDKIRA